ncbi:MAG TPA: methyltransferase [Terracidiphilus sp.]|nr:methyltransferase [Terracidiphilus sp.]
MSAPITPERIFQFAWGYAPPLILEAALQNKVFDVLDAGPMNLQQLSEATGASLRGLRAIVNFLVGMDFLSRDAQGNFALTPESAAFLVSTKPSFQGGLIKHTSKQLIPNWLHLNEVVKTGKPAAAVNQEGQGAAFFQELVPEIFPMSYPAAQELAAHLKLTEGSALDLAAGSGVWGIALAQAAPALRVTAVDWPEVLPVTQSIVERFGLSGRFTFSGGDLLSADFGSGHNAATLGHILHSEGVGRSKALLAKTFAALASGGVIAIQEFLVTPDRTGPVQGLIFAVNMLVNTEVGDTFSFEEISAWLLEAGFVNPRTIPTHGPSPIILATKP